ncbi:MAG: TolC family protein [Opitutales bacterium]|nr:TolC family protein [Opitutales bacterium]
MPEDHLPELAEILSRAGDMPRGQSLEQAADEVEAQRIIGRSHRLPRVHASTEGVIRYEVREDIEDRFRFVARSHVHATQPIWHWGSLEQREAIHGLYGRLIELEAWERSQGFLTELREHWLYWFMTRAYHDSTLKQIERIEHRIETEERLLERGESSEERLLDLQLELAELSDEKLRQEADLGGYERRFAAWLGGTVEGPPLESTRDTLLALEFSDRRSPQNEFWPEAHPQHERKEWQLEQQQRELAIAQKATWPKLDIVGGVSQDELEALDRAGSVLRWNAYVGLRVDWPIFDGRRSKGEQLRLRSQIRRTRDELERVEADLEQTRERLQAEVELHQRQVQTRQLRLRLAERRLDLAKSAELDVTVSADERFTREAEVSNQRLRILESTVAYLINRMHLTQLTEVAR